MRKIKLNKAPKGLGKLKAALRKIVRVLEAEVDRRIAEERKQNQRDGGG